MPTDPIGGQVRNAINLTRFENGVAAKITNRIDQSFARVQAILFELDPTAVLPGNRNRRIQALNRRVGLELDELYKDIGQLTANEQIGVAQAQELFATKQLQRLVGVTAEIGTRRLGKGFWRAIVTDDPVRGAVMRDWWAGQKKSTAFKFRREIQQGLVQQETLGDIVRRIRGRATGRRGVFSGGIMETSTREATTLARTAINQVSNTALFETYRANDDVTEEYVYTVTFDGRTSDICISLSGRTFRYDDSAGRRPPQHHQCRSVIVPVINWQELGLTEPPPGQRAAEGGPVKSTTTYSQWLRDQPQSAQNEILGPGRAKLFRSNKLSLRDLVRSDGKSITLEELTKAA